MVEFFNELIPKLKNYFFESRFRIINRAFDQESNYETLMDVEIITGFGIGSSSTNTGKTWTHRYYMPIKDHYQNMAKISTKQIEKLKKGK